MHQKQTPIAAVTGSSNDTVAENGEDFFVDLETDLREAPTEDEVETASQQVTPVETTIKSLDELPSIRFVSDITVQDLHKALLTEPDLLLHHLEAAISLAEEARATGQKDEFDSELLIACQDPAGEPVVAAKIRALNEQQNGYLRGPELPPQRLSGLTSHHDLVDIVRCFRILGLEVTATNTPTRSGALPVHWRLFYRPGSAEEAAA